MKIKTPK